MTLTRRTFVAGTLAVAGAGALAGSGAQSMRQRTVRRWAEAFGRIDMIRDLGVEYATRYPDDASESAVLDHLATLAPLLPGRDDESGRRPRLRERLRRDFAEGDMVAIGGWRFSRTELRLCTLVAQQWNHAHGVAGVFARATLATAAREDASVFWTAPSASVRVVPAAAGWECRMRAGGPSGQRVTLRVAGRIIDEFDVAAGIWQRVRYPIRGGGAAPFDLELSTVPTWTPAGDFRTLGVGLDRISFVTPSQNG